MVFHPHHKNDLKNKNKDKVMKWQNLNIGTKLTLAFGTLVGLLLIIAGVSYSGMSNILKNSDKAEHLNAIQANLEEKHEDHLIWVQDLNRLITDNESNELHVETDHRECGFGQWYYGEDRIEAERADPKIRAFLAEMEEPHKKLHQTAVEIDEVYKQADYHFNIVLRDAKSAHLE